MLAAPAFDRGSVGIVVRSLATDETVYTLNAPRLMMPASTLKVVTLAAAAERLGWDHAYETRIVADGPVDGGTLEGNLVIVGSGDPSLDRPVLDSWAAQIKMLGVAKVTGTVLADARAFSGEGLGFGWSWDDLAYYYAAPIAAVQFRENAVDITVRPGPSPDAPVTYELMPAGITALRIENRMNTGARTAAPEFVARRAANSATVVLEGVLPVGSAAIGSDAVGPRSSAIPGGGIHGGSARRGYCARWAAARSTPAPTPRVITRARRRSSPTIRRRCVSWRGG